MSSPPPDWIRCQTLLDQLLSSIEAAQEAALLSLSSEQQADVLAQRCSALSQQMAEAAPELNHFFSNMPAHVPPEVSVRLARVQAGLDALGEQTTRLEAGIRQKMNTLFPDRQGHTYARPGGRRV
jgi:hypothetical protein